MAGTPFYIAPEILKGHYDKQCDMWSIGVLLYILVSGRLPFAASNRAELFDKIALAKVSFQPKQFEKVSEECKDLISKLLVADPAKRLTGS